MLAPEEHSGLAREAAEDDVGRVDDVPRASDLAGLRGVGAQWSLPSLLKWWSHWCDAGLGPRRLLRARDGAERGSPDGPVHNLTNVTGRGCAAQIDPRDPRNRG
ncbi:hypothetical protein GCM10028802_18410 [Terrabacter terrigena]